MPFIANTANETDTLALMDCLSATPVGETCTFAALSDAIGRDVARARFLILRAIRRLNADGGALFASVHRVGYKRLSAAEAHQIGSTTRARIRRAAHAASTKMAHAMSQANDIPDADRRRAMAEISSMNMLAHLSAERVSHALPDPEKPRPIAEALAGVLAHIGAA